MRGGASSPSWRSAARNNPLSMDQVRFMGLRARAVALCLRAVPALALTLICASCGGGGDRGTPTVGLPPTIAPASAIPGPVAAARAVGAEPVIAQTMPP